MTQEEKGKAYERALAKARDFNFQGYMDEECLYDMFPELRESEDEKVRKEIIDYCHERLNTTYGALPNIKSIKRWLIWLEKQESVEEIVSRCKNSWYNEGKIAGMAEGLTDDEKYQQGWHDALEKQGKQKPPVIDFKAKNWYVSKVDGKIYDMTYNPTDNIEPKFKVGD